jgi:acetyltransferase-like isoleucine patch superfamily enzyme
LYLGKGVVVEKGVLITGKIGAANKVVLGDFSFIGQQTRIIVPEFRLGDYSKVHCFSFLHGEKPLQIGRNCWIGENTILDSMEGLDIDDNVGIGAHSQFWTHIQFGDIVEGCRFFSKKYMYVGKDAWFVGHCIVSPIHVGERSMALAGSVVTKDMVPNHIYSGVPAKDITDKLGFQFESPSVEQKAAKLQQIIDNFVKKHPEHKGQLVVALSPIDRKDGVCWFDVSERTYNKTYSKAEVVFLKENIPLIKFVPFNEPLFIKYPQEISAYWKNLNVTIR